MVLPFALVIAVNGGGYFIFLSMSIYATLCSLYLYHVQCAKDPLGFLSLTNKQASSGRDTVDDFALLRSFPSRQLNNATALRVALTNTTTLPLSRRLWDPGIRFTPNMTMAIASRRSTSSNIDWLLWNRSMLLHDADNATTLLAACCVNVTMVRRLIWDPGIASCAVGTMPVYLEVFRQWQWDHASIPSRSHYSHVQRELVADSNVIVTMIPTTPSVVTMIRFTALIDHDRRVWDPGIHRSVGRNTTLSVLATAAALIQSLFQYSHPVLSRPIVPNIQ